MHLRLRALVHAGGDLATTDAVVMEVLAGGRDDEHVLRLRRLLLTCELIPTRELADYEEAAAIHRRCRAAGRPVRTLVDCLIAAVALRAGAELLHADRDFDVIARHLPLRIAPV